MPPRNPDRLSPQLRSIESEIDNAHKANPLTTLNFATAAWNLLAFSEDVFLKHQLTGEENAIHQAAVLADTFIAGLSYPLYWLSSNCPAGGDPSCHCDNSNYKSAWELSDLGRNYKHFCAAFTYASRGMIDLNIEDSRLIPVCDFLEQSEYEAYNRLIRPSLPDVPILAIGELAELIQLSLRVNNNGFSYNLSPKLVKAAKQVIGPELKRRFLLPDHWQFSRYTLGDFRRVFEAITAMALIHWYARYFAITAGCEALGYADSIFIPGRDELLNRTANYSGVEATIVANILCHLTYGSEPGPMPDPALQPLISLNPDVLAIMPNLWLNNSAERNLTVLLNRLPQERPIYSSLVDEKEALMRSRFEASLALDALRLVKGEISGASNLPDIDLAIIEDASKTCLLFELKWFIEPAEVREVIEKTEELEKGVRQLLTLKRAFEENHLQFLDKLQIDSTYALYLVLASENWIGHSNVQNPMVSIIKSSHVLEKLKTTKDLRETGEWLRKRQYLPTRAIHYEAMETEFTIKNWTLNWYGIKPLLTDIFFPA